MSPKVKKYIVCMCVWRGIPASMKRSVVSVLCELEMTMDNNIMELSSLVLRGIMAPLKGEGHLEVLNGQKSGRSNCPINLMDIVLISYLK